MNEYIDALISERYIIKSTRARRADGSTYTTNYSLVLTNAFRRSDRAFKALLDVAFPVRSNRFSTTVSTSL